MAHVHIYKSTADKIGMAGTCELGDAVRDGHSGANAPLTCKFVAPNLVPLWTSSRLRPCLA